MKLKHYIYAFACCGALSLQSCEDFLNTEPKETYSDDTVWSSPTTVDAFLASTYSIYGWYNANYESWEKLTTNAINTWGSCPGEARGLMTNEYDFGINNYFTDIRNCNLVMEKVAASTTLDEAYKKKATAEAKMLRAMIYYDWARHTGRFIWVDHTLNQGDTFTLPLTKSIKESYDYVLKDINDAIEGLPQTATAGRPNKNAALALKSEICLTAAAYTGDKTLYQQAVDAVDAIQGASLDPDYGSMFNEKGAYSSPEILLARYFSKDNTQCGGTMMINLVPNIANDHLNQYGYGPKFKTDYIFEAWMTDGPTENLVDNYLVIDQTTGKAVKWNESTQFKNNTKSLTVAEATAKIPPYDEKEVNMANGQKFLAYESTNSSLSISDLMYQHRDKRFDASIVHDGSTYFGEDVVTRQAGNLNRNSRHLVGQSYMPLANYMWRKGIYNVSPRVYVNVYTDYHYVILRYGRALLNKAEALLCLAKDDPSKLAEAVATYNQTRTVHGGLPASTATTLSEAWEDYKRERRVDLALEGDYYWSLLRWGKYGAEANHGNAPGGVIPELSEPATFPEISADGKAVYIGNVQFQNNERVFMENRGYLYPIPKSLINANSAITDNDQNPGW